MRVVRERMEVVEGDITTLKVDAIVNAANDRLAPGGGVCAALGGCPTGEARITPGFDRPARWIVHAVGPVWQGGDKGEPGLLAGCYRRSLELAASQGCRSVAFCCFGADSAELHRDALATIAD